MSVDDQQSLAMEFRGRQADIAAACVSCGACFEVCPITGPAGLDRADAKFVTEGVRAILRGDAAPAEAETWAKTCVLSGDCIEACEHGINPRLMLAMARMSLAERDVADETRITSGKGSFRTMADGVKTLSQVQLTSEDLARLGQGSAPATVKDGGTPDVLFYTGCNVLKTPHIALLCLDIMDVLGDRYQVVGGPSHCCGVLQYRTGDYETSAKIATNSIEKFAKTGAATVLSWCPTCQVQFGEIGLPMYEGTGHEKPFEMTPFILYLADNLDRLKPYLTQPVKQRVALHLHPGIRGLPAAARKILDAVPGVEVVDLDQPQIGLMSNALATLPEYKKALQLAELTAAEAAGVDALAAVYHADHRELCAHERDWPFRVINMMELVAASMGIVRDDYFKRLKIKQDVDAVLDDCADMLALHRIPADKARPIIEMALFGEQPVPLRGG